MALFMVARVITLGWVVPTFLESRTASVPIDRIDLK